jgi:hypothetical protein
MVFVLLAGTQGSLDKSLSYLQKSDACSSGRQHVQKELGVTQLCIGTKKKDDAMLTAGKANLAKAAAHTPLDEKMKIDVRHSKMLIADPSLACGNSRDGQQETDESKIPQ